MTTQSYSKMNDRDLRDRWIAQLRSGDWVQGAGSLCPNEDTRCCLGVLCETMGMALKPRTGPGGDVDGYSLIGPHNVPESTLYGLNDTQGLTFPQIADWIEENL